MLAGAAHAAPPVAVAGRTWRDAAAYCRAVGTVDTPDRRYVGPKATAWMRRPFTADGPDTGPDGGPIPIAWRCMDGQVKVCAFGANAPCDRKADVSRRPTADERAYCRQNPDDGSIPLAVAGHDSVYDWSCHGGRATPSAAGQPVDRRGFEKGLWRTATP